jgi:hypothetical protein
MHSSRCGDVLSSWAPTMLGMALRCPRWQYGGWDGRIGAELAEEMRPTSPSSRCRPMWARGRRLYPFRGFRRPLLRGCGA